MSWVFILSLVFLLAGIVLVELRAIREGDERRHHAPGYSLVLAGLVLIGLGMAAAVQDLAGFSLVCSVTGLAVVALGATRHEEASSR